MTDQVDVCTIDNGDGTTFILRGSPAEALAASLNKGDSIRYRRKRAGEYGEPRIGIVDSVWMYEGPMVRLVGETFSLCPACGDEILEVMRLEQGK